MHLDTLSADQTSRGKNIFTQQGSARTPSKRNLRFLSHCTILYVLVQQWNDFVASVTDTFSVEGAFHLHYSGVDL